MLDIAFAKPALPESGALVLLLAEEDLGGTLVGEWDKLLGGHLARGLAAAEFKGRKGQATTLYAPGGGLSRVVLVGLGKRESLDAAGAEAAGGHAVAALGRESVAAIDARAIGGWAGAPADVALGAVLRAWRFDRYRTKEKPEDKPRLGAVKMLCEDPAGAKTEWASRRAIAEGVFLTRELVSEPANILNPPEFADRLRKLEKLGVEVEVFGQKDLEKLGFGSMLCVSQGSAQPPRMVVMRWNGTDQRKKDSKPLAFIGKGVTFDTGGISIKPAAGMEDMKWDMAGAGVVAGLMAALAGRKAKVDVVGLVGLVENMPSGTATRPGDVVTSYSGQTIEVINTDAEGRLVLADVLSYCKKRFDPAFMVNLATLTGAIIVALGNEHAGLFSNDDGLARRIEDAGKAVGELAWRMPLGEAYDRQIRSEIADMKNVGGGRAGGSITAAQFLQRFVDGCPWAHLDIAGVAWSGKDQPTAPKGATAWGVRLLDRLVAEHHEGRAAEPRPEPAGNETAAVSGAGIANAATLSEGTAGSEPIEPAPDMPAPPAGEPSPAPGAAPRGTRRPPARRPRR
ncbi:leucyl aminopeptidase [Roseomonas sp. SSH11]|uniref:Probable cytosol aminopeptidase n=1 Tax=Pararoseomonas baculiformis TaxID=2820812 RepID=A0ABS4A9M6_9PROT|nr:leucyl aminopeptidase [Pararoseomonas baculiformis]MBP0443243.1 leucyl aminopeptidase [Pararoseomonas baculiformis]